METRNELSQFLSRMIPSLRSDPMVGGARADSDNSIQIIAFKTAWFYLAADVLVQAGGYVPGIEYRLINFHSVLRNQDILTLLNICQSTCDLLLKYQGNFHMLTWEHFKGELKLAYPDQVDVIVRLLSPINPSLDRILGLVDIEPEALKSCLQFLRYGKKLNLKAIGLEEKALEAYLDVEDKLARLDLSTQSDVLNDLNKIMRRMLRRLDLRDLVPNHGSGSVAEGNMVLYDKFKQLSVDLKLSVVCRNSTLSYYDSNSQFSRNQDRPLEDCRELIRVSRTIFVPKTFSKLRTISMEPVTLQYWQQAIMKRLYSYFRSHPRLRYCIQLEDQSYNRRMAKRGSKNGTLATIDLSAASDSVSWSLVKRVFYRTPLLKWLYATRSDKTLLPNGKVIELNKFAPMGSALCFPVQCLLFASVIEYITQKEYCTANLGYPNYAVYGDDLIVSSTIVSKVILVLTNLGFTINEDKSFVSGKFRESCGGDYYDGIDVSSLYYRFKVEHKFRLDPRYRVAPELYAAITSAINECAKHRYGQLRVFLISLIKKYSPHFCSDTEHSPSLFSPNPTNHHVILRYREDYQQWVGRFCTVLSKPQRRSEQDGDDVAYFVKLAQMATRKGVSTMNQDVVDVNLYGSRIRLGYVEHEVNAGTKYDLVLTHVRN